MTRYQRYLRDLRIRELMATGVMSERDVARRLRMSPSAVHCALKRVWPAQAPARASGAAVDGHAGAPRAAGRAQSPQRQPLWADSEEVHGVIVEPHGPRR